MKKPEPKINQILVKIHATTVNRTDSAYVRGIPFFIRLLTGVFSPKNKIPGTEFAGIVEQVGKNISSFQPGDRVFGFTDLDAGAHAEYVVSSEENMEKIPESVSFIQAAPALEGFHYALNFINKVELSPESRVLVNGATGAIGSAMVQILKTQNVKITAVCKAEHADLVQSLGAERVIDFEKEDFCKEKIRYDYVFDAVGKTSFFRCFNIIKKGGAYMSSDLGFLAQNMFLPLVTLLLQPLTGFRKTIAPFPVNLKESIDLAKKLMQENKYKPLIDKVLPFNKIIEAYDFVKTGKKTGNVVIEIQQPA